LQRRGQEKEEQKHQLEKTSKTNFLVLTKDQEEDTLDAGGVPESGHQSMDVVENGKV